MKLFYEPSLDVQYKENEGWCFQGCRWGRRALERFGGPGLDMPRIIDLYCVRAVLGLLTKSLSCTPADCSSSDFSDSVNECQCCKNIFMDSLSSLERWILLLPLKGNGLLTAYPKELTLSLWACREWLEGMKGQMEPERTETFWCVVTDRASGWRVWCLWAELNLTGQTVKPRARTWNTVK